MKNSILSIAAILFLGRLFVANAGLKGDADVISIMNKNAENSGANSQVKITFKANGKEPVGGYVFASETLNFLTLTCYIGGVESAQHPTSKDDWCITPCVFGAPLKDTPVRFKLQVKLPNPGFDIFNDTKLSDNLYHIKTKGFSGYEKGSLSVPGGIWLGWEDWLKTSGGDMDYNDMCFIAQGLDAYAEDFDGHIVQIKPPPANSGTRIINWREENKE